MEKLAQKFSSLLEYFKTRKVLFAVFCVALLLVVFIVGFSVKLLVDFGGKNIKEPITVEIEKGTYAATIAQILEEENVINHAFTFRLYAKLNGYEQDFKYGTYTFSGKLPYKKVAKMLTEEGETAKTVTVTIPEGTGINDFVKDVNGNDVTVPGIATLLERGGVCTKADFLEAVKNYKTDSGFLKNANDGKTYYALEGFLFPETYEFYAYDSKECAVLAIEKMVAETEKRFSEQMILDAQKSGKSINEILTLASIIQMESGQNKGEMPNVAAVFYNRLNDGGRLGSSPTIYYGNSFSGDDNRYNTYQKNGLPPGPLCSAGIDAIKAALYPTENFPYPYFITDKNGKFYYHKTYAEQLNTIERLKRENNWIYEYYN